MTRVVIAGLGDSGLLTAMHLARHVDVVGISSKPAFVSGQELGTRLARPDDWAEHYLVGYERYRRLDRARTVHGRLTGLDLDARAVHVELPDGTARTEQYDVLVVATGVTNGFWRRPHVETRAEVDAGIAAAHDRLAGSDAIVVVGGGAAAVSTAANLAAVWPGKRIDLHFPGDRALTGHHVRVWQRIERLLTQRGVGIHPGHRAAVPDGFAFDEITRGPVTWTSGQPPTDADAVVWAIGRVRPNTDWLPAEMLDEQGFVRVGPDLRVPGRPEVFAIGDVAATDPLRSSARNRADKLLARNIRASLAGRPLRTYEAPRRRWGSVLGVQPDGLVVFAPNGRGFRFPRPILDPVFWPVIVDRGIYGGIRRADR